MAREVKSSARVVNAPIARGRYGDRMSNIRIAGQVEIKPGKLAEFMQIAARLIEISRTEPNTVGYEWYTADDKQFHVFERFTDSAALLVHMDNIMPDMERILGTCDLRRLVVYGDASPEVKHMFGGLGATFMTLRAGFHR